MTLLRNALPNQITADEWDKLVRSVTMCALAFLLCLALCVSLFFKNYVEPIVLTAVMGLANFVLGYLAGKRTPMPEPSSERKQS